MKSGRENEVENEDLKVPENLSLDGIVACGAIIRLAQRHRMTFTGGCKAFYSPKEWEERGESYGCDSELVVVYDGSELSQLCRFDGDLYGEMRRELEKLGLWIDECMSWYAAVYKL
jgi:hypothetical protein|tara:strand:+ start:10841 stop:11188 length:348 start_codon:yes stop_codon:yes gene_type:complete